MGNLPVTMRAWGRCARGSVRLGLFLLWSFLCCLRLVLVLAVTPPALQVRLRALHTHQWARGTARILGLRLRMRGWPPKSPCLLVANHLGYLDILAFSSALPSVFVSKSEVKNWPLLGWFARLNGTIFLDRQRPRDAVRVNGEMILKYEQGAAIVVFPEGTSSDGRAVGEFRPALLEAAARGMWPVIPSYVRYRSPGVSAAEALCWHGDRKFVPHFWGLLCRGGFVGEIRFAAHPLRARDRRRLAEDLHEAVLALRPGMAARNFAELPPMAERA